jgi:hypothetical protein
MRQSMTQTETKGSAQHCNSEGTEAGETDRDQDLVFTCANCGEMTDPHYVLSNRDLHEAEQTIHFLLGYGCDECQASSSPERIPAYADRYLLRLIRHFLFTRLPTTQDRIHLLLILSSDLIQLQQELLGLPMQWRDA